MSIHGTVEGKAHSDNSTARRRVWIGTVGDGEVARECQLEAKEGSDRRDVESQGVAMFRPDV